MTTPLKPPPQPTLDPNTLALVERISAALGRTGPVLTPLQALLVDVRARLREMGQPAADACAPGGIDLAELEGIERRATPAPWSYEQDENGNCLGVQSDAYSDETPGVCGHHSKEWPICDEDAELIATGRNALRPLIAVARAAQAAVPHIMCHAFCDLQLQVGDCDCGAQKALADLTAALASAQPRNATQAATTQAPLAVDGGDV